MNWRRFLLIFLLFLGVISVSLIKKSYQELFAPKIGVTIFPFYDVAKEIIKDKFEVVLIVPPGAEPHNYELTPTDLKKIRGIKIIFSSGTNLDKWADKMVINFKNVKVVKLNEKLNLIDNDPHFWLSLENMKTISRNMLQEIESFDYQNKDFYQANFNEILKRFNDLENFAKENLSTLKNRNIVTQHNAFQYLAKELNLNVFYLEEENKEITPANLKNLIDIIRLLNIKVIFQEPGEKSRLLETIAKELNLKIYQLDPIEGKSGLDYFSSYKKNIEILNEALRQ